MYKILKTFEIAGYPKFEEGKEYVIIPEPDEMIKRGLISHTEIMIDRKPDNIIETKEKNKKTKISKI